MNSLPEVEIIELVSIMVGTIFGVLASITDTKTKSGRLSKWGFIAVAGILMSHSLSLYETYEKGMTDALADKKKLEQDLQRAKTETDRYYTQLKSAQTNIRKSDSALTVDIGLQQNTATLIADTRTSLKNELLLHKKADSIATIAKANLDSQSNLIASSHTLLQRQNSALDDVMMVNQNVIRTLSPVTPFGISVTLSIKLQDSTSIFYPFFKKTDVYKKYTKASKDLLQIITKQNKSSKVGVETGRGDSTVVITNYYKNWSDFNFLRKIIIHLDIWDKETGLTTPKKIDSLLRKDHDAHGSIHAAISASFKSNNETEFVSDSLFKNDIFPGIHLEFNAKKATYYVTFFTSDFPYSDDRTLKGLNDLSGCLIKFEIYQYVPADTYLSKITFHFPPSFSTTYNLEIKDRGTQFQRYASGSISYTEQQQFSAYNLFK